MAKTAAKLPSYKTLTRNYNALEKTYIADTEQLRKVINGSTESVATLYKENTGLKAQLASTKIDLDCARFALENMTNTLKEFMLKARLPKDRAIGTQGLNSIEEQTGNRGYAQESNNVQANRN